MGFKSFINKHIISIDEDSKEKDYSNPIIADAEKEVIASTPASSVSGSMELINQMEKDLWDEIHNSDYKGVGILKFLEIVKTLEKSIPGKEARYQAAWSTIQVMGISLNDIKDSFDHYMKELKECKKEFEDSASQMKAKASENESRLSSLDSEKEEKEKMIQQLTDDILKIEKEKKVVENELESLSANTKNTTFSFDKAFQKVTESLTEEFESISKYSGVEVETKKGKGKK